MTERARAMARERMIIWQGISKLDNVTPIVVLATYDTGKGSSANRKTGDMVQTWILRDDMEPHAALKSGADTAICGTCPHRSPASGGSGACYVTVFQAPLSIYRAYKRGNNRPFDPTVFAGRKVRFGAYGDPAAAPFEVWAAIAGQASAVTGYTHAWRTADSRFSRYMMASADSIDEYRVARRAGYRAFVVRPAGSVKPNGLVECPASAEAGKRVTCSDCLQCGGTSNGRTVSVTIAAHGASARRFVA